MNREFLRMGDTTGARDDARMVAPDDPRALLRAWVDGEPQSGWTDDDIAAFSAAVVDEVRASGGDPCAVRELVIRRVIR